MANSNNHNNGAAANANVTLVPVCLLSCGVMGAVLAALGFGGDEGGGDAAVKRQAEGLSNPMYQLANLMGQVRLLESCLFFILLYSGDNWAVFR